MMGVRMGHNRGRKKHLGGGLPISQTFISHLYFFHSPPSSVSPLLNFLFLLFFLSSPHPVPCTAFTAVPKAGRNQGPLFCHLDVISECRAPSLKIRVLSIRLYSPSIRPGTNGMRL